MIKAQSRTTLCQSLELPCHPTHIEVQGVEWSGEMEGENSLRAESAIHMFISKLVKLGVCGVYLSKWQNTKSLINKNLLLHMLECS